MINEDRLKEYSKYNGDELVVAMRDRINVICSEQGVDLSMIELVNTKTDWERLIQNGKELYELAFVLNTRLHSIEKKAKEWMAGR